MVPDGKEDLRAALWSVYFFTADLHPSVLPPERRIPRENVTVAINETRDALEVSLIGLGQVHPLEGHYQGLAYIDERPLATIQVLVTR